VTVRPRVTLARPDEGSSWRLGSPGNDDASDIVPVAAEYLPDDTPATVRKIERGQDAGDPLLTMEIPGRKWGSPALSRVAESGLIGCDSRCWDYSVRLASTVGVHILVTCEPSQQLAGNSASQR
jgi:hypothetical protein